MVDFKKKLKKKAELKKTDPIEIYENLDRTTVTGPLRDGQKNILQRWYADRYDDKDVIVKLHTGEGKTLVGLLMLYSKLNKGNGPCMFVCPNKFLVSQAIEDASKFGIPVCQFSEIDNDPPYDFTEGKKILITHVQKVFNGLSVFGVDRPKVNVGSIVIDDAHFCAEEIKRAFTIKIKRQTPVYNKLLKLFEEDIKLQGEVNYMDLEIDRSSGNIVSIPYWSWDNKLTAVISILSDGAETINDIRFPFQLIQHIVRDCQMFMTNNGIEIQPYLAPINKFKFLVNAGTRILMSATTQEDSFFIKGLGFSIDSINTPLMFSEQKWSGEKMILMPSLIDERVQKNIIIQNLLSISSEIGGKVFLVPSLYLASEYSNNYNLTIARDNIGDAVKSLKLNTEANPVVFVNRYDGIDLPDSACRLLVIDSKPFAASLYDRYEEQCRPLSDVINMKIAQKIEQGLGRSVRGEKDFSAIVLVGADLVKFVRSSNTNKYFSDQTLKQISLCLEISEDIKKDVKSHDPMTPIIELINQLIKRDESWKEYYKEEMDSITIHKKSFSIYEYLIAEKEAEEAHRNDETEKSCEIIQKIIRNENITNEDKGWYLQMLARYKFYSNKSEYNNIQKAAFKSNYQLFKPLSGISYRKLGTIDLNRIQNIKKNCENKMDFISMKMDVDEILENLSFGISSNKFEQALYDLGELLGFECQRPDKEIRKGPDVLWNLGNGKYIIYECKSEVSDENREISKHEAGQMNSHCGWFENEYGNEVIVKNILVIPTNKLSYAADFTHEVKILRKDKLSELKQSVSSFVNELKEYELTALVDAKINDLLNIHEIDTKSIMEKYFEGYLHQDK